MMFFIAIIFSLVNVFSVENSELKSVRRYAFIVGKNVGGAGRPALKYATSDAKLISDILDKFGGVEAKDNFLLLNPSKETFINELDQLKNKINNEKNISIRNELFLYYSGHADETGLLLDGKIISYAELKNFVKSIIVDVSIVVLDSCASGTLTRLKGGKMKPPFMLDESSKLKGQAFLTSSSWDEASQESDKIKGSYFSYYLGAGLRGAADSTHDGKITLNEAYQYAYNETIADTEKTYQGTQHPSYYINLVGTGELVITDIRNTSARLVIPQKLSGNFFIRDEAGNLVVQLNKESNKQIELALNTENYEITLQKENRVYKTNKTMMRHKPVVLAYTDFMSIKTEKNEVKGAEDETKNTLPVFSISSFFDEKYYTNFTFKLGYKYFYAMYNFAFIPSYFRDTNGFGAGVRIPAGDFTFNLDFLYSVVGVSSFFSKNGGDLKQIRFIPSYSINKLINVFVGLTINFFGNEPATVNNPSQMDNVIIQNGRARRLGAFVGLEFKVF